MKEIKINIRNSIAKKSIIVDDEDYERAYKHNWWYNERKAIYTHIGKKALYIGRFILDYNGPLEVDHIDRDIHNNQKINLRIVTKEQQSRNRGPHGTSIYKGIKYHSGSKAWYAQINIGKKNLHLGTFISDISAARAYDAAVKKYYGVYGYLNFPNECNISEKSD